MFGLNNKWRLRQGTSFIDDGEPFGRITVEEIDGNKTEDIWILQGEFNTNVEYGTFYIGNKRDVNPIDWSNQLFR